MQMKYPESVRPKHSLVLPVTLVLLILLIGGGAYYFVVQDKKAGIHETSEENLTEASTNPYLGNITLSASDAGYQQALRSFAAGDLSEGISALKALESKYEDGSLERNVIDYDLAYALSFTNEPLTGIQKLKDIVTNSDSYTPLTRALAVEALVRIYYSYQSDEITKALFEGKPFEDLIREDAKDHNQPIASLLQYGLSIHATPITAERLAALTAYTLRKNTDITPQTKEKLIGEYERYAEIADTEVTHIEGNDAYATYLANFYLTKALALADYSFVDDEVETSTVEELFEKAYSLSRRSSQVFTLFNHAAYLSQTSGDHAEKIESLVSKLRAHPETDRRTFDLFIENGTSDNAHMHRLIKALMAKSPSFTEYVNEVTKP